MKLIGAMLSVFSMIGSAALAEQTACVITTEGNVAFSKSTDQLDREYGTLEKAKSDGITFYLRAGHGVIRLEAWKNGKLVANTFAQEGNQAPYGDSLTLAVHTPKGEAEAQCDGINAATAR